jgi:hypothetical protein
MPSRIDNARHWRECAEEALAIAAQMPHADGKAILTAIAHGYAELARLSEARKERKAPRHEG